MISRVHSQVPGLGHRVSGSGLQEQVQVPGLNPNLYQYPYLQPRPETRDDFLTANRLHLAALPRWVGAPLRGVRGRTELGGLDHLPGSSTLSPRTDATPSRPYLMMRPPHGGRWVGAGHHHALLMRKGAA